MKHLFHHRPSASMVVAVLALIVGASGTAIASFGPFRGDKIIKKGSLSGNRLRKQTITGNQINLGKLGKVPSASSADSATIARSAASASTASNALALGGVAPSGYARSDCSSRTGQIRGFALVPATSTFSQTFTDLPGAYNCSGQAVQAKRFAVAGEYEIKFLGSPAPVAVGSVNALPTGPGIGDIVSFEGTSAMPNGDFFVHVRDHLGNPADVPFEVLTP